MQRCITAAATDSSGGGCEASGADEAVLGPVSLRRQDERSLHAPVRSR